MTKQPITDKTTPGSDAALKRGCKCPVIDNHYGHGIPGTDGPRFWISGDCPLHWYKHSSAEAPQ